MLNGKDILYCHFRFALLPIIKSGTKRNNLKKGLRDCLTIVAHELTHIGYFKISKGKLMNWENKFLDEGIAGYAMYPFEPNVAEKKDLSLRIAKADLKMVKLL